MKRKSIPSYRKGLSVSEFSGYEVTAGRFLLPGVPRADFIPGEPEPAAAAPTSSTHSLCARSKPSREPLTHPAVSDEQLTNQPLAEGRGESLRACTSRVRVGMAAGAP